MRLLCFLLWSSILLFSCAKHPSGENFNPADTLLYRQQLGEKLFFDSIVSRDYSISCASCHQPGLAFSDGLPASSGMRGRQFGRNSPSLLNVKEHPYLFSDGGVPDLILQALSPVEDHNEMDMPLIQVVYRLQKDPEYRQWFKKAFQREPDAYGFVRALAAYQQTLVSEGSRFDSWLRTKDSTIFTNAEWQGLKLFYGKANCSSCHNGKWLSDFKFYNIGIVTSDPGRQRISLDTADIGKFKTPILRNLTVTAPYMHNGSITTLKDVVSHFNAHQNLALTARDQEYLVKFLETLTDTVYLK